MMKSNIKMSHVLTLLLLAALLFITTLLSSSLRQTFMYFIMNLLVIALGAEAGLFKASSSPLEDHCQDEKATTHVVALAPQASQDCNTTIDETHERKNVKVVEKSRAEKVLSAVKILEIVKKCPSLPSIFFIGGDDDQVEDVHVAAKETEEEEEDLAEGDPSGQELLTKADTFIGNFYKQLKMQRNESRKQIHGCQEQLSR